MGSGKREGKRRGGGKGKGVIKEGAIELLLGMENVLADISHSHLE